MSYYLYMKLIITGITLLMVFFISNSCLSQTSYSDTISVVAYNVNNYGIASSGSCPTEGSPLRHSYLRTVMNSLQPDIVSFEKINGSPKTFSTDTIRLKVMDSVCLGCYANTVYTNVSGYSKVNSLFYKVSKFGYLGTTGIYTTDKNISDINMHKLYYKSLSLATTHDTVFVNVIVIHDDSGSGSSDSTIRSTEIGGAMSWLATNVKAPGNYIFMGDFNTQTSNEGCFQSMINNADTMVRFYDAPNKPGLWSVNPTSFANYLTQSTRTTDPGDCAAVGGINDWFDHILFTKPILTGTKNIQYLPNSFYVVGQDGLHTNKAINASPTNTTVSASVLNALYLMSEHLPVAIKMVISKTYPNLPVDFLYFNVIKSGNYELLKWQISNDFSAQNYEIEISTDNQNFTTLDYLSVDPNNKGIYSYTDINIHNSGMLFYRIKQNLKDGNIQYSDVKAVSYKAFIPLTISPNPVRNSLAFKLESNQNETAGLQIINSLGQVVNNTNITLQSGTNNESINSISNLPSGIYILKIITSNNIYTSKFIKE